VWEVKSPEPLLLIAGGSGVVPLMSMIRHRSASKAKNPLTLLYSSHSHEDIIYSKELEEASAARSGITVHHTLTRNRPPDWKGYARRIDQEMISDVAGPLGKTAQTFICGPTLLVESAADALLNLGFRADQIRTERFGPTGG
jgi:ferredoxin-NADP reductase